MIWLICARHASYGIAVKLNCFLLLRRAADPIHERSRLRKFLKPRCSCEQSILKLSTEDIGLFLQLLLTKAESSSLV